MIIEEIGKHDPKKVVNKVTIEEEQRTIHKQHAQVQDTELLAVQAKSTTKIAECMQRRMLIGLHQRSNGAGGGRSNFERCERFAVHWREHAFTHSFDGAQ